MPPALAVSPVYGGGVGGFRSCQRGSPQLTPMSYIAAIAQLFGEKNEMDELVEKLQCL